MSRELLFFIIACLCFLITFIQGQKQTKYFLWPNPTTGDAQMILSDGSVKQIETLWVGYAAWTDVNQVRSKIREIIARGNVPYIHAYNFGDSGLRGQFEKANAFDLEVAKAIGGNIAFINIDTEWDVSDVLNLFQSAQGQQSLLTRVQNYKTYSPNAIVTSSPGLWGPASSYTFFKDISKQLDARSILLHIVSNSPTCGKRIDGSVWTNGVNSLQEGKTRVIENIISSLNKMNTAWGDNNNGNWFIADTGVTQCDWGQSGQSEILNEIIKNLDCLYAKGFRGFNLRNQGPDELAERAMGIENEGRFIFTNSAASKQVLQNGFTKVKSILQNGIGSVNSNCQLQQLLVQVVTGTSEFWAQIEIKPSYDIQSVNLNCNGKSTALNLPSWSDSQWVNGLSCPLNSQTILTITYKNGDVIKKGLQFTPGATATDININVGSTTIVTNTPITPTNTKTTTTTSSSTQFSVKVQEEANEYWTQLFIEPAGLIKSVVMTCQSQNHLLEVSSWSKQEFIKAINPPCPLDTPITVTINLTNGSKVVKNLNYSKGNKVLSTSLNKRKIKNLFKFEALAANILLEVNNNNNIKVYLSKNSNDYWVQLKVYHIDEKGVMNVDNIQYVQFICGVSKVNLERYEFDKNIWFKPLISKCKSGNNVKLVVYLKTGRIITKNIIYETLDYY
ncbi:hypothetical protein ABK040_011392 [Willaertia magna]